MRVLLKSVKLGKAFFSSHLFGGETGRGLTEIMEMVGIATVMDTDFVVERFFERFLSKFEGELEGKSIFGKIGARRNFGGKNDLDRGEVEVSDVLIDYSDDFWLREEVDGDRGGEAEGFFWCLLNNFFSGGEGFFFWKSITK